MSPGPTFGPYPTSGVLGSGGMGVVYLAWDPKLGRELAIKTLSAGRGAGEIQRRRFSREARALAELSHPGLVSIVDAGVQDGVPWLAMLRVPGQSLESLIRERGRFSSAETCALGVQLCSALAVAHSRGILHRDLKPENILVTPDERYVVTDFGLTKDLAGEVSGDLSQTGALIGTPGYWSPEQARGQSGQASPAIDVYGLGAVLYAALTGVPPISAPSLLEAVVATQERPPTPPSALCSVSPALETIVLKCLNKSPEDRYDSVDVLEEALRELSREKTRRVGVSKLFLGVGAAGAFLSGVLGVWFATGQDPHERPASSVSSRPTPVATPVATPEASAPLEVAQGDVEAQVRRAIAIRAWDQGDRALAEATGLREIWLRHLLLRAEVEWRGSSSALWRQRKKRAEALADRAAARAEGTPSASWARALQALTGLLKDPFVASRAAPAKHKSWEAALEVALSEGLRDEVSALALHEGLTSLAIERANRSSGGSSHVERARARISAWEAAGGARWKVLLARSRLELIAGKRPKAFVSAVDELGAEARRVGRPWLIPTTTFFRGELTLDFARTDQVPLWSSLCADLSCPPVMRGHAANRLAALLLEADKAVEALNVLSQAVELPRDYDGGVLHERAILMARGHLRCRRPEAALEVLAEMPTGPWASRRHLLRGIALAHLGKLEESRAAVPRIAEAELQRDRFLIMEFAALTVAPAEAEGVIGGLFAKARPVEALACADQLEHLATAPGFKGRPLVPDPEPLRRVVAAVRKKHFAPLEKVISLHLERGLWELAARRVEQALGGSARHELRARLDYRLLRRGLEQVRPGTRRYQILYKRSLALATRELDSTQPSHRALVSALLTLGEEPWRGSVEYLERGMAVQPSWSEFYDAFDRVFRARQRLPSAHRNLSLGALQNVRRWLEALPKDWRAALARAYWSPATVARRALDREGGIKRVQVMAKLERARVDARDLAPSEGSASLSYLGHGLTLLTRSRAEVFLDAAEVRLRVFGDASQALLLLDLLRAWCGDELGDRPRYHLLQARALLRLGRAREAYRAIRQAHGTWTKGHGPELQGRILATLGQSELACDRPEGKRRIKAATKLAPCFEVWLAAGRSASGAEAESCYGEAFSYLQHPDQIEPLWDEVIKAGLSAPRVCRLALRHFEGRGPALFRVRVAHSLFARLNDLSSARSLCQAVVQHEIVSNSGGLDEPYGADFLRASQLLSPELRALVESSGEVLKRTAIFKGERSEQAATALAAALDTYVQAGSKIGASDSNDFWLPAVLETCGGAFLGMVSQDQFKSTRSKELRAAREARKAKEPSIRLELWIARLEISLRDPKALESLERALAVAQGYSGLRLIVQLERGLLLRRLGRNKEALRAYDDLIYRSEEVHWKVLGLSLKAQILRHQGAKGRKQQLLELGRAQCFGLLCVPSNVQSLFLLALAQAHLDNADLDRAGAALEAVDEELKAASSSAVESERSLLGATLARLRGNPAKALALVREAGRGAESAAGLHRERALTLCDLGRRPEAIAHLSDLLQKGTLWPREHLDLEELLKELTKSRPSKEER